MRILHLIYDHMHNPWIGGGGAIRAYEIYKRLSQKGHQICIVSGGYPHAKDYKEENIEFKFVGIGKNYILSTFSYMFCAQKYLMKNYRSYDVIIEDFAVWNPLMSFRIKDRPVIVQIQNYLGKEILKQYFLTGALFYFLEKPYVRFFDNWIVLSDVLNKRFNIPGEIIPQAIEGDYLGVSVTEGTYLAFLGRIDIYQKGLDLLLRASEQCEIVLKIAGSGKDKDRFKKKIEKLKNAEWVGSVHGKVKLDFLKNAIALIAPSRYEGQGMVILEAAACGKPVIVSDIAELKYAVDAGFGISFKSGNAKDLANRIKFLLEQESLRKEMGQKAREYARDYTWDKIAEQYEQFLEKVVNND